MGFYGPKDQAKLRDLIEALTDFLAQEGVPVYFGDNLIALAPALDNPPHDAALMERTLTARGFEVTVLIDGDQREMKAAIRDFGERLEAAGEDAVGLFYYAGHGVQVGSINYLIPIGAIINRESDVDLEAVSAQSLLGVMSFARNRLNFVILDACRNNPYKNGFRAVSRGLAKMDGARGTLIAYSTSPGDVALDGSSGNSPYTLALAEAMAKPGLSVGDMFQEVREAVLRTTNDQQLTWEGSSLTGRFYFNPADEVIVDGGGPVGGGGGPSETAEIAFWDSIKDSGNAAAYPAYLTQFPTGVFALLARIELEAAESAATGPDPDPEDLAETVLAANAETQDPVVRAGV